MVLRMARRSSASFDAACTTLTVNRPDRLTQPVDPGAVCTPFGGHPRGGGLQRLGRRVERPGDGGLARPSACRHS